MPVVIKNRFSNAVLLMNDGANLRGAELRGANLRGAELQDAELQDAELQDAELRDADLQGAKGYVCLGYDPRGYHFRAVTHADGWRVTAGCRDLLLPDARAHWQGNPDALARLSILAAHPLPSAKE